MTIHISQEAREHLDKKGKVALTLAVEEHRMGGCAMGIAEPAIRLDAPKDAGNYHRTEVEGITVYTSFVLRPKVDVPIEIGLDKVLGFKMLVVSGFDMLG